MDDKVTMVFSFEQARQVIDFLSRNRLLDASQAVGSDYRLDPTPAIRDLSLLLTKRTERLARFVVENGGEFFNDDLAKTLKLPSSGATSVVLGRITRKLRKVGIGAQGHRGHNWYSKIQKNERTFLRVQPEIVKALDEALKLKAAD